MSELQIAWLELGIVGGLGTIFVFVGIMMVVVSVGVQGETRLKPRNFGDFQRYPQSAYFSTLQSSALKITELSAVEVGESRRDKSKPLLGT